MSGSIQQEAALLIALVFRVANGQVMAGERPCENSLRALKEESFCRVHRSTRSTMRRPEPRG